MSIQICNRVVNYSQYVMHSDKSILGNVMFLKGHIMMCNKHYIYMIQVFLRRNTIDRNTILYLSNTSGNKLIEFTVGYLLDNFTPVNKTLSDGTIAELDCVMIPLDPKIVKCHIHPDITKLFITKDELNSLNGNNYDAILPTYNSDLTGRALGVVAGKTNVHVPVVSYKYCRKLSSYLDRTLIVNTPDSTDSISFREFWVYDGLTTNGDCGSPVIIQNTRCARKIIGIHSAGSPSQGLSQTLTQETILETIKKFDLRFQASYEIPLVIAPVEGEISGSVPIKEGLIVEGLIPEDMKIVGSGITKIIPSRLHGEINGEPKTAPTKLHTTNGVDPMYIGLKKFGKYTPLIDEKLIKIAIYDVNNNLNLNPLNLPRHKYARILTYEEAVVGVEDDEFLAPLNRGTSCGFPYTKNFTNLHGKREAFGYDDWTLNTPLAKIIKEDVEKLIINSKNQIQTGVYWTDTLKMERRSLEKIAEGKTRVFCAGPVHFTIAFRQYFLGFAAFLMHNRNHNEFSTGTNVFSQDWDVIARKILSHAGKNGDGVVAGDFSNFDGSLNSQILWYILDMINDWYDDGETNALIRRGLWYHIVNAIHINGRTVYRCTHSQPSGCPLTAILNSIYNSIVVRITYILCAVESGHPSLANMNSFNENVSMVAYGDDNLIAILETVRDWFNQVTICEAFLKIGHVYTDETKTGHIVPVKNLTECAYLKRKFVMDQVVNRHVAPLALDVVLEIPQWTKIGILSEQITIDNIDVCMRELSLHPENIFDHYFKIICKKCVQYNIPYRFRTYDEYRCDVLSVPLFEGENRSYILHWTSQTFDCSSKQSQQLIQDGYITPHCIQKLQSRHHSRGFFTIDTKRRVVHLLFDQFSLSHLKYRLQSIKPYLNDAKLQLPELPYSANEVQSLKCALPFLI